MALRLVSLAAFGFFPRPLSAGAVPLFLPLDFPIFNPAVLVAVLNTGGFEAVLPGAFGGFLPGKLFFEPGNVVLKRGKIGFALRADPSPNFRQQKNDGTKEHQSDYAQTFLAGEIEEIF